VVPKKKKAPRDSEPVVRDGPLPLGPAPRAPQPSRIYVAVGVSRKGQKGPVSGRQLVLLAEPASAPGATDVTYDETSVAVTWTPPADAWPPAPAVGTDSRLRGTPIGTLSITGGYNVYEVPLAPAPRATAGQASGGGAAQAGPGAAAGQAVGGTAGQASGGAAGQAPGAAAGQAVGGRVGQASSLPVPPAPGGVVPTPLNATPLPAPPFVDKRITFGQPRCYAVRAVTLYGTQAIEGDASPTRCVTPADTFAPPAPTGLRAVGSGGAVNLVWDASQETDVAGYLVLRAPLPGGEFTPLTTELVKESTFSDTTAARGVRYAYVVVAVDTTGNRSMRSNQVEEAAR